MAMLKVDVPEGKLGQVEVRRRVITAEEAKFNALQGLFNGTGRFTPAGTWTGLLINGHLWMSDTPDEQRDQAHFARGAEGDVLIVGLGLGLTAEACLHQPKVRSVTVVEIMPEVVALVGEHYKRKAANMGKAFTVVQADFWQWAPSGVWDTAWVDIWPNLCTDDLEGHARARRKLRKHMRSGTVQNVHCWAHELLKARRRDENRRGWG